MILKDSIYAPSLMGVEAITYPVRGLGYLVGFMLVLDLVISGVVLIVLRDTWQHWLVVTTLLALIATLTVVLWALLAVWQGARPTLRHKSFRS